MAAPRATSFKALLHLQRASNSVPTKRTLHITGGQASPQRIDPTHKTVYLSWGLQELRNECQHRTLTASGAKHELIDRLAAHDSLQHRAFSMAMRRISRDQQKKSVSGPAETTPSRQFNTSRANKTVNDSSTIDFAYLPNMAAEAGVVPEPAQVRVPILPHIESDAAEAVLEKMPELQAAAGGYQDTDAGHTVMKAEISQATHSADTTLSAMSDVHDGHHPTEMTVEMLTKLTDTVGESAQNLANMVKDKDEATIRKVWNGFLDDVFGSSGKAART